MDTSSYCIKNKYKENLVISMPHTIVYPNTVMIHSENTPFADTTMMRTGRFIGGTLLAVSQISTLPLDLMYWRLRILDVRHVGEGDAAGVTKDSDPVGSNSHNCHDGEQNGVGEPRRRREPKPFINDDENGGIVEVANHEQNDDDGKREIPRSRHFPL